MRGGLALAGAQRRFRFPAQPLGFLFQPLDLFAQPFVFLLRPFQLPLRNKLDALGLLVYSGPAGWSHPTLRYPKPLRLFSKIFSKPISGGFQQAKVPRGATVEQFRLMLQNLLGERFKLHIHKEKKELPVYALVVMKGGPKMKESPKLDPADEAKVLGPVSMGRDGRLIMMSGPKGLHMQSPRATMERFEELLSNLLGLPVIDQSGLTAEYEISLDFSPEGLDGMIGAKMMKGPPPGGNEGPGGGTGEGVASIFTAVQALGLKLESRKGPVDLIVVDSAQKMPSEN
jgi:uncharacterized protein (TIGR03435 family)